MTTARNSYANLSEYKAYAATRGVSAPTSSADDAVIDMMLEAASRDYEAQHYYRQFYPTVRTLLFDVPEGRLLRLDDFWLLEVIEFLNGNQVAIAAADYVVVPSNSYPIYALELRDITTVYWYPLSTGSYKDALSVTGIWGFHDRYATDAWVLGSTLAEDLDTSETDWLLTAITAFTAGQIVRVGNEIGIITSATSDTAGNHIVVSVRGDNGSTAATHLTGANVYYWSPMTQVKNAVLDMVNKQYAARYETSLGASNPASKWTSGASKP